MMAVTVAASGATVEAGKAVALFFSNLVRGSDKAEYAVARDGRFLINQTREGTTALPITLIQHWSPEAKK